MKEKTEEKEEKKEDLIYFVFRISGAQFFFKICRLIFFVYRPGYKVTSIFFILWFVIFQQKTAGVSTAVKPCALQFIVSFLREDNRLQHFRISSERIL